MISTQLGGILIWMFLSIGLTSQAQNSVVFVRNNLHNDYKHKQNEDSLSFSRFTFLKKGATFNELYDSLQKMKGYSFQAVGLDNYNIKADCNLKNASIEECLHFIETKFHINCERFGSFIKFSPKKPGEKTKSQPEETPRYDIMQSVTKYYDGYQSYERDKAPGAYQLPDSPTYKPMVAPHDVGQLLLGITFQGAISTSDRYGLSLTSQRGRNTLFGNYKPTFSINGFTFNHYLELLNPFDLNMPTILEDAVSGAVQGSESANGVFATTSKKFEAKGLSVNYIQGVSWYGGTDLNCLKPLDASTLLELRQLGVNAGPMAGITTETKASLLMQKLAGSPVNKDTLQAELDQLGNNNMMKEIKEKDYRHQMDNQTYLSVGFGKKAFRLYGSIGYDKIGLAEKGNAWSRTTSLLNMSYKPGKCYYELTAMGTLMKEYRNFTPVPVRESYLSLYNPDGSEAAIPFKYPFEAISTPQYAVYSYKPLEEARLADNQIDQRFYLLNGKIGYAAGRHLQFSMAAQYGYSDYDFSRVYNSNAFLTRDLINDYKQPNGTYPIPQADIRDRDWVVNKSYGIRPEIDYMINNDNFSLAAFMAGEKKCYSVHANTDRLYNFNSNSPVDIDYNTEYALALDPGKKERIPNPSINKDSLNNFASLLGSLLATFKDKYTLSMKLRNDRSNRFSEDLNRWGVCLWSIGGAWHIKEEFFRKNKLISDLSVRGGYGANGNIDYSMPPLQTISATQQTGVYGIDYPQTPRLRVEKLHVLNLGLDFQIKQWMKGRIDYYQKKANNLLNTGSWNPTTGFSYVKSNSGKLKGSGVEINLQTNNINISDNLSYCAQFLFSYNTNKVTSPNVEKLQANQIVEQMGSIPMQGYAADALFAYRAAKLDHNTGEPQGILGGEPSKNYDSIRSSTDRSGITYVGSSVPRSVFNFSQRFVFKKKFVFSFLITGRLNYVVHVPALSYYSLYNNLDGGSAAYYNRWKVVGDEERTNVPALVFPLNQNRDLVYTYNETNFVRGDNIRLQNLQLGYSWNNVMINRWKCKRIDFIASFDNIKILYKKRHLGIDPDVPWGAYPNPRSITFSLNALF
ncbi:hypothetical protein A4D02_15720 [Niastella koreensis]|uniref:TonB-dependent receptor plug n=2 Tax=Niastella koreensis TaxID=354356 RepID=G8TPK7_NIAKG|nr:hypothetical protein [Niastella koreensis]AEV97828.1 hypothetical protein Niako_1457 [Niastella koreensis GR20-10]OQP40363.1 hypothetical protein A4D02_15720 [Niastella koreensis]